MLAVLLCGSCLLAACGSSTDQSAGTTAPASARTPLPAPDVSLTSEEKQVWARLPPDRSAVPVVLFHGIGSESDFSNAADATYGVGTDDFAKQRNEGDEKQQDLCEDLQHGTLWSQRCRWSRGQGEALRNHGRTVAHWRNRRLWPIALERSRSPYP